MKSAGLANRFRRAVSGSSIVEFTIIFPVLAVVALGTVDFGLFMYTWNAAAKATHAGVRRAVVSPPVASGVMNLTWDANNLGANCSNSTGSTGLCPTVDVTCTSSGCTGSICATANSCSTTIAYSSAALDTIRDRMREVLPAIQSANIQVSYVSTGLGFVGRPDGVPMTVTVSLRCLTQSYFFIDRLLQWTLPGAAQGCPAAAGVPIPAFPASLPSESLGSTFAVGALGPPTVNGGG
ncbi:TadE/TadG family type IV pilus assembly protein [Alsobacter sp. R-9]